MSLIWLRHSRDKTCSKVVLELDRIVGASHAEDLKERCQVSSFVDGRRCCQVVPSLCVERASVVLRNIFIIIIIIIFIIIIIILIIIIIIIIIISYHVITLSAVVEASPIPNAWRKVSNCASVKRVVTASLLRSIS